MVIHAAPAPEEQAVPPCIIDWSDSIARAEHDLEHDVIVTVIGASPLAPVPAVAGVLAANLDVDPSSLVLRRASSSSYLLMLPDLSSVTRLVNLKQPLCSPEFSLLCKKWSRLAGATGKVLPCQVDVEICGIPAHVWETSTVEQLLNPHAWIDHVHETTVELNDLSSFRCSAWCLDVSKVPPSKELWVAEPPNVILEDPPVKRFLSYPTSFKTSVVSPSCGLAPNLPPPPPHEDGSDEDPSTRQRWRLSASAPPRSHHQMIVGCVNAAGGGDISASQARGGQPT